MVSAPSTSSSSSSTTTTTKQGEEEDPTDTRTIQLMQLGSLMLETAKGIIFQDDLFSGAPNKNEDINISNFMTETVKELVRKEVARNMGKYNALPQIFSPLDALLTWTRWRKSQSSNY